LQGSRVTSDGGLILVRELDERLGFGELIAQHLTDPGGKNAQLGFADLPRQSVYSRLAGYEDLNDAERLSQDPTFRLISSDVRREPSDAAPVQKYAAVHRGSAATSRVGAAGRRNQSGRRRGVEGGVSEKSLRNQANHGFWAWAEDPRGRKGPFGSWSSRPWNSGKSKGPDRLRNPGLCRSESRCLLHRQRNLIGLLRAGPLRRTIHRRG
jgi:hypothetical protein